MADPCGCVEPPIEICFFASVFHMETIMRISERGQITIPKKLRDQFGINHNVEVDITPTRNGLLIHKRTAAQHPVERVFAMLSRGGSTDDFLEEIRGR